MWSKDDVAAMLINTVAAPPHSKKSVESSSKNPSSPQTLR
jgi:hypothetical protein